jgi:two-component system OmpR family sensor kinase
MSDVEFLPSQPMAPHESPAGPSSRYEEVPDDREPRRPRLWLRSLQSRLVVGVVALVVVLVAAIGSTTYVALRSFLFNRLDQQLNLVVNSNSSNLGRCLRFQAPTCSLGDDSGGYRAPQTEWVTVLDANGDPTVAVHESESLRQLDVSTREAMRIVHDPTAIRAVETNGNSLRISAREIPTQSGNYVVVSGLSTDEVQRTLGRLVLVEIIIGGAAVLLAFAATTWGVRRSLRNLYAVTGTAREVAAELSPTGAGLDRRVPVVEEGTEVGQLAESMNTLLAAVETQFGARLESEQRMRQFLADASHELRTPLTSIRGYAELARMQRAAGEPAGGAEGDNLDRIESEGTRMSRLVDDLLLLARGDADDEALAMHHELVDLNEVLDDAVSGSRAAFPERPISLEVAPVPPVVGDRDQLLRVVRNLVNNAAVHTEAGRPIHVRAFTDAGGAVITVADGGPGLPPEQAAHVFERFWRADKARTRARGGSGLGLSIVATIVRRHGGSVRFDSTVEGGSTVTVWLPAAG